MEKRNTNRQREYRDDYRQHSPAWIRAQRRKRKRIIRRRIMIGSAVICIVLIAGVIRIFSGGKSHGKETEASAIEESTFQASDISVNGISLKGMTRSEAKAAIEKEYPWKVTITYNGESIDAENLIDTDLDAFLDGICTGKAEGEYTFAVEDSEDLQSAAAEAAADAAAKWDVKAKNGSISEYDAATDKFLFADGAPGKAVNQEKLIKDLVEAATSGNYDAVIQAEVNESQPELSAANAKEQYKTLSTFTTETTANEKRNTNVKLAARAINGTIVQPGEEFSFNKVVGQRTAEKGYQEAAAYSGGEVVQEPGGGVCQVSSTLYNAVVFAGLKTTERHAHTYEPSYVTPGEDAMVSYDGYAGPDLRFVNNSKTAVGIKAAYSNQTLTVSIYGNPILEDGVTVSMHSEKIKELDPPTPTYVEDPTLEPGVEVVAKAATPGSRWQTKLITKKNGQVVSDVLLHNSTYTGKAATIKRNTSGTVAATESASADASAASSEAAGETTAAAPAETTAAATTALETTAAPTTAVPSPGENYGPGYVDEATTAAAAETNQAPSDMGLISPNGQ